ncbi:hypothetical protein GCM10010421_45440 [Streptomyces glaucus]|uniref:Secreted protein n=1 Tax=Streptomyces glaucus TaxID=284029 RepID=A0ABN3K478_9ACTN
MPGLLSRARLLFFRSPGLDTALFLPRQAGDFAVGVGQGIGEEGTQASTYRSPHNGTPPHRW